MELSKLRNFLHNVNFLFLIPPFGGWGINTTGTIALYHACHLDIYLNNQKDGLFFESLYKLDVVDANVSWCVYAVVSGV